MVNQEELISGQLDLVVDLEDISPLIKEALSVRLTDGDTQSM